MKVLVQTVDFVLCLLLTFGSAYLGWNVPIWFDEWLADRTATLTQTRARVPDTQRTEGDHG